MAIKTSWTAGEVLTAADLTDTLADKVDLTPSATQTITSGTATVKPLVIKAAASQTANLLEFQNSAGTAVRAVLPDGTITGQNLLYNGAMQVSQRGTSTASITTSGYYTADRWQLSLSNLGTWTQTTEADAPTGSGLRQSIKLLCTTAKASPAADDTVAIQQALEGQDLQRIAKGTASAQQLTVSFWVKSNVTGTYVLDLQDADNTRSVGSTYTISASATWEKKTITFPADTTGPFDNDNAASLYVRFWLGAGSNRTSGTLNTSWATRTTANIAVGQTNLAAAINNYWQVTGVQLEVGPVASAFEFKPYGQELRECQRYYWKPTSNGTYSFYGLGNATSATNAYPVVRIPTMRVVPTAVDFSNLAMGQPGSPAYAVTALTVTATNSSSDNVLLTATVASGLSSGTFYGLINNNNSNGYLGLSAEL